MSIASRRTFLKSAAVSTIGAPYIARTSWAISPNAKLAYATFGVGRQGVQDMNMFLKNKLAHLHAFADVDDRTFKAVTRMLPDAKSYQNWRELLEKESDQIDMVTISTPVHMHALIAYECIQRKKHIFCQTPLAHNVNECRRMSEWTNISKVATQMGIQLASSSMDRQVVQVLQDGVMGKVKEVHTFTDKSWGGNKLPEGQDHPVPEGLDWDQWLGVAKTRPYIKEYYHPRAWRRRVDFGAGTLGDVGPHVLNSIFRGLGLSVPLSIRSIGDSASGDSFAANEKIEFTFAGTPLTEGNRLKLTWYSGKNKPPDAILNLVPKDKRPYQGNILVCENGTFVQRHGLPPLLLHETNFKDYRLPLFLQRDHYYDFIDACETGNRKTAADFNYTARLTETVLLGNIAARFPNQELQWNAELAQFSNLPTANRYLARKYRSGYEIPEL